MNGIADIAHSIQAAIDQRGRTSLLLLAPILLFKTIFFVIPFFILVRMSLHETDQSGAYNPGVTLDSYVDILSSSFIHGIMAYTFRTAIVVTIVTLLVSIPYAHAAWRADGMTKNVLLLTVVVSLLTTLVVKMYAWVVLLSPIGVVSQAVNRFTGADQVQLLNNEFAVVVGIVYMVAPYAILAIYSVLVSIDEDLIDAALDLGASRPRAFYEVVLPNAVPGIAVATVLAFTWSIGAYAAPVLLGSSSERTFAVQVEEYVISQFNWPHGAALSVIIVVIVFVSLLAFFAFIGRRDVGGEMF
ncbi:ABC transporter permease [Natrarchaeobius chitinivorans]|uniref:ABC transporter permease n=1 Tax=Natrarchaeobius chitinivorans TaxID=1679083 RepID=A0A3N6LLF9_NATCH|nr:ABC transporter permease [Natrarchaeobius chitinivorans]RQG89658.1 ABC transporter permease [Natrarchaeobius chitinivorans]